MTYIDIQLVSDIVRAASTHMDRTGGFEVHDKGVRENIVPSSDLAVQHFLTEQLRMRFPEVGFLCEEEDLNEVSGHEAVWVIGPIDGTANYARGNENCCISVALVEGGEPVLGVVYSPWRGELYTAEKGKGAFCNGKPIHSQLTPVILMETLSSHGGKEGSLKKEAWKETPSSGSTIAKGKSCRHPILRAEVALRQ